MVWRIPLLRSPIRLLHCSHNDRDASRRQAPDRGQQERAGVPLVEQVISSSDASAPPEQVGEHLDYRGSGRRERPGRPLTTWTRCSRRWRACPVAQPLRFEPFGPSVCAGIEAVITESQSGSDACRRDPHCRADAGQRNRVVVHYPGGAPQRGPSRFLIGSNPAAPTRIPGPGRCPRAAQPYL